MILVCYLIQQITAGKTLIEFNLLLIVFRVEIFDLCSEFYDLSSEWKWTCYWSATIAIQIEAETGKRKELIENIGRGTLITGITGSVILPLNPNYAIPRRTK